VYYSKKNKNKKFTFNQSFMHSHMHFQKKYNPKFTFKRIQTCIFIQTKDSNSIKTPCIIYKNNKKSNFIDSNMYFQIQLKISSIHKAKKKSNLIHSYMHFSKSKINIQTNFMHSNMHFSFRKFTKFHAFINALFKKNKM